MSTTTHEPFSPEALRRIERLRDETLRAYAQSRKEIRRYRRMQRGSRRHRILLRAFVRRMRSWLPF